MNEPAVLLVDEPTSALDHERGAAVLDLLRPPHPASAPPRRCWSPTTPRIWTRRTTVAEVRDGRLRPGPGTRP